MIHINFCAKKAFGRDNICMSLLICKNGFIYTSYIYLICMCKYSYRHTYTRMWTTKNLSNVFGVHLLTPNFREICRVGSEMKRTGRNTLCNNWIQSALHSQYIKLCSMYVACRSSRNYKRLWQKGVWIWLYLRRKNLLPILPPYKINCVACTQKRFIAFEWSENP
jgi:hypothetical protein